MTAMLTLVVTVQLIGWFAFGKERALAAVCFNVFVGAVVLGVFCYYLFRLNSASCAVCLFVIFGIEMSLMQGTTKWTRDSLFYYAMEDLAGRKTGVFETGMVMDVVLISMGVIMIITAVITAKVSKSLKKGDETGPASFLKDAWSRFTEWEKAALANNKNASENTVNPVNRNEADHNQR